MPALINSRSSASSKTKTALVTGASSGIGKDFAVLLAQQGFNLLLVARRESHLQILKIELEEQYGIAVEYSVVDLSDLSACSYWIETLQLVPDVVINNAGVGYKGKFIEQDWEKQHQMMRLNMDSLTYITHIFGQKMAKKGAGAILQVASIGAFTPCPNMAIYDATKAYVLTLGEALHQELKPHNVTVTSFCPGGTRTEFFETAGLKLNAIASTTLMDSKKCAQIGLKAMFQGKSLVVPGMLNKVIVFFLRHSPRFLLARVAEKVM
jgi:short-subunit dehydrogenase